MSSNAYVDGSVIVDPVTGAVDGMNAWLLPAQNVDTMGIAAYLCFALMVTTVALAVLGIHKDVAVCTAAVKRLQATSKLPSGVAKQLLVIAYLRRWVFSPALVWVLFVRVIFKGFHPFTLLAQTVPILMLGLALDITNGEGVDRNHDASGYALPGQQAALGRSHIQQDRIASHR